MDTFLAAALEWLRSSGAESVRAINDTTRSLIRDLVSAGVTAGLGTAETAVAIREAWPEVSRRRARTIARTETLAALNAGADAGHRAAAEEFGLELEKVWISAKDSRTRESHIEADGQAVPLDEPFTVGGHACQFPADPSLPADERVQCRCTTVVRVVGQKRAPSPKGWRVERDAKIRAEYPEIKDAHGSGMALSMLAERYALSERTIERALGWG